MQDHKNSAISFSETPECYIFALEIWAMLNAVFEGKYKFKLAYLK